MSADQSKNDQDSHFEEYKMPDEILIDNRFDDSTVINASAETKSSSNEQKTEENPISLRWLFLLGLIFSLIFGLVMLFGASLLTILALVFLLSSDEINQNAFKLWKLFLHTAISTGCCLIGLVFPPVGLSLLLIYLLTSGAESNSVVSDIMRKIFGSFFR